MQIVLSSSWIYLSLVFISRWTLDKKYVVLLFQLCKYCKCCLPFNFLDCFIIFCLNLRLCVHKNTGFGREFACHLHELYDTFTIVSSSSIHSPIKSPGFMHWLYCFISVSWFSSSKHREKRIGSWFYEMQHPSSHLRGTLLSDKAKHSMVSMVRITPKWTNGASVTHIPYLIKAWSGNKILYTPDSKVDGANMGPIWVLLAPGGSHVGPINLVIWDIMSTMKLEELRKESFCHYFREIWQPNHVVMIQQTTNGHHTNVTYMALSYHPTRSFIGQSNKDTVHSQLQHNYLLSSLHWPVTLYCVQSISM